MLGVLILSASACISDGDESRGPTTSSVRNESSDDAASPEKRASLADNCDALAARMIELVRGFDASLKADVTQTPTDCAVSYLQPDASPLSGGYFYLHLFQEPANAFEAGKSSYATGAWLAAAEGLMTRDESDRFEYRGGLDKPLGGHVYVFGLRRGDTFYSLALMNLRDTTGVLKYKDELESVGETLAAEL